MRFDNYAQAGTMTGCKLEKEKWAGQDKCHFSTKSANADRCMYFVNGCNCDCLAAQLDLENTTTPMTPPSNAYDLTSMAEVVSTPGNVLTDDLRGRYQKLRDQAIASGMPVVGRQQNGN